MSELSRMLRYTGEPEWYPEPTRDGLFDLAKGTLIYRTVHPLPGLNPDDSIEFSYTVTMTDGGDLLLDVYGEREEI